jgi:hypothetical protein
MPDEDELKDMDRFWAMEYENNMGLNTEATMISFDTQGDEIHMNIYGTVIFVDEPAGVPNYPGYRVTQQEIDERDRLDYEQERDRPLEYMSPAAREQHRLLYPERYENDEDTENNEDIENDEDEQ